MGDHYVVSSIETVTGEPLGSALVCQVCPVDAPFVLRWERTIAAQVLIGGMIEHTLLHTVHGMTIPARSLRTAQGRQ